MADVNPFAKYAQPEENPFAKYAAQAPQQPAPEQPEPSGGFSQGVGNLLAGAVRGAGSIGATIVDQIRSKLADPVQQAIPQNMRPQITQGLQDAPRGQALRAAMDSGLQEMGAQPESMLYKGGQLAGEVAGTAGVGGVLGKGLSAVPALAKFAPMVQSGGLTLGPASTGNYAANLALRAAGGAANGAATAALINPEMTAEGALAGAALPVAVKGAQYAGKGVSALTKNVLGRMTGTSPETISAAYRAGQEGSVDFLRNMRGDASFDEVVDAAKAGLEKMRADRGAQYRNGMLDISADKTVLDFAPIDSAMRKVQEIGSYKGIQTNKNAAGIVDELSQTIAQWRQLNPAEYHTPEGLDALKRAIGDIRDATQFGSPARRAADSVYNSVKGEITKQAPVYSKVMGDYSKATEALQETERVLSLGKSTSQDTAIRKLQSLMRNNAQSNYGNRLSIAQQLEEKGGVQLTPAIAGQAMNTWVPRGVAGQIQAGGIGLGGYMNPAVLAALPFTSPRLVGETAYRAGLLSNAATGAAQQVPGLLSASPQARQIGQGLLTTLPIAISTSQTARQ
ncbi:hypothetical protein [Acidovorax sp. Root70]|uniref:hypothetical protein n=1 Tax=Acidovorax sp. Root70 TaxID=1736590 RepID=UPI0006F59602|nr:hypothetical protein [Acidovorax sp. Root70]KRB28080.1 hypothetical protein ASD94_10030 [Acidovorax sp. Root70]